MPTYASFVFYFVLIPSFHNVQYNKENIIVIAVDTHEMCQIKSDEAIVNKILCSRILMFHITETETLSV